MSTKQKVLLVVVAVVLIVLFVVALAGRDPGQGSAGGKHGFLEWLSGLGGKQSAVPADLVHAPCKQSDGKLHVAGSCTVRVDDPGSLKLLVLRSGTAFAVSAPAPGDADVTANDTVEPDNGVAEAKVAVDKETNIVVACVGSITCVLSIGDS
jgi:hypothetical protein